MLKSKKIVKCQLVGNQPALKIHGNIITPDLLWDSHVHQIVIPSLANRAHTLKAVAPFMNENFR